MTIKEFENEMNTEAQKRNVNVLSIYKNGNHFTCMMNNGTKIKETVNEDDDHFTYDFPENFDLKICNKCSAGCLFCHENSTPNGCVPNLLDFANSNIIKSLHSGTEIAVGGGNVFEVPYNELENFFNILHEKNIVTNITVNQRHVHENMDKLKYLISNNLVHGIGISLVDSSDKQFEEDLKELENNNMGDNIVLHVINGIFDFNKDVNIVKGRKLLILGYKDLRRGHNFLEKEDSLIKENQKKLSDNLKKLAHICKLISFDCLGIEQLNPKNNLGITDDNWNTLFQGSDTDVMDKNGNITCSTMYIDLCTNTCARMSTAALDKRYSFDYTETIEDLFKKSIQGW